MTHLLQTHWRSARDRISRRLQSNDLDYFKQRTFDIQPLKATYP
jgi:hypothetical protein